MKGIAFTFDDDVSTHHSVVAPMFEKYGLKCTFFINGGNLNLWRNRPDHNGVNYALKDMGEEQILSLYVRGFEIGNHTLSHLHIGRATLDDITNNFRSTEDKLSRLGIDVAPVFSYPGYVIKKDDDGLDLRPEIVDTISKMGYKLGRIGYFDHGDGYNIHLDNNPQIWERDESHYYKPKETDPFFVKCCGMFCDNFTFNLFEQTINKAPEDSYCVFNGHVFTLDHQVEKLEKVCKYCADKNLNTLKFSELPL